VQFIFGVDNTPARHVLADDLPADAWQALARPARYEVPEDITLLAFSPS
jgi:hypothetical protein